MFEDCNKFVIKKCPFASIRDNLVICGDKIGKNIVLEMKKCPMLERQKDKREKK